MLRTASRPAPVDVASSTWTSLYRIGGVAALIAAILFRRNIAAEYLLARSMGLFASAPAAAPTTVEGWFTILSSHRLVGLVLLNLFDVVNCALVGLIFLGLYAALRRANRGLALLALALTLVGVGVYFASNQAFPMVALSEQYTTAATDEGRSMALAAGQALLAIHGAGADYGTGLYLPFFLISLAGLLFAAVMLRSPDFTRAHAYLGIVANVLGLGYYLTLPFAPVWRAIPLSTSAPFLMVWYILIGLKLLRLDRAA